MLKQPILINGAAHADADTNPLPLLAHVMRGKAANAYDTLASSDSYRRVSGRLKLIDLCAATLAAISTAYANGYSHTARIGMAGATVLALLAFAIVEFSTFTLEDGLRETFKGGTQRLLANLTYWAIRATMVANGALLSCFIAGVTPPAQLRFWSHWSFAFHLAVGLVLIPLIRNADPVTAHRMLELKAETAHADLVTTRKSAAIGNPVVLASARVRGFFDALALAWSLLWQKNGFAAKYAAEVDKLRFQQFGWADEARSLTGADEVTSDLDPKAWRR